MEIFLSSSLFSTRFDSALAVLKSLVLSLGKREGLFMWTLLLMTWKDILLNRKEQRENA
eukprot:CAMPEP_0194705408 /NCGR_PEP_ID=MMETSP0295-20121207/28914_1 /TAXON_ID=39354 /ORGANISM="Heterosigma akashiwo, Strain CCMP2393" /LENGTH=58 /DNA_ID=CAMNT_0039601085 /DNA_START=104 /DNA_END=276 /DNA_ORIENTATION=+